MHRVRAGGVVEVAEHHHTHQGAVLHTMFVSIRVFFEGQWNTDYGAGGEITTNLVNEYAVR
jgi:hypothetical protein